MRKLTFSVVIPLFNKAESIQQTLESVLAQKHAPEEIIVVNDGSTDNSVEVVKAMNIPTLKIIEQKNQGVSVARNRGVKEASQSHIAFLDADDVWSPFYLLKMAGLIAEYPKAKVYASSYQKQHEHNIYSLPKIALDRINSDGTLLHDYFHIVANGDLPFMTSSVIFEKTFYQSIGGCPVGEVMGEDQSLFASAALATTIAYSPLILLSYRTDAENRACDRHIPDNTLPFVERLLEQCPNLPSAIRQDVIKYCGATTCHLAKQQLLNGRPDIAKKLLSKEGVSQKPLHWLSLSVACMASEFINKFQGNERKAA